MWSGALCLWVLVFSSTENFQVATSSAVPSFSTRTLTSTSTGTSTLVPTVTYPTSTGKAAAAIPAFAHHVNLVFSKSTLERFGSTGNCYWYGASAAGGNSPLYSYYSSGSNCCSPLPGARSLGLKASMGSESRRRRRVGQAATAISSGARLLDTVLAAKEEMEEESLSPPAPSSPRSPSSDSGGEVSTAVLFRGGGGDDSNSEAKSRGGVSVARAVRGGTLVLDKVEDVLGDLAGKLQVVLFPVGHLIRLGFGLSLMFYGMAFQTLAFHIIVFRIAGFKQVRNSLREIVAGYQGARKTIRAAASAAESMGERVIHGDQLKASRAEMIAEKKRLMSDGFLSAEETRYFMEKYNTELKEIKEEQDRFKSAKSSILSVRGSVNPKAARASLSGVYNALVASFTASTIQTAGQITLGLHIGSLLKTHILDLFGPILDPIGYRLDLDTYYDDNDIPYMGKANAMDGPSNMFLNVLCYSIVFLVIRVHPSTALKAGMVYYGARVVTDYVIVVTECFRRKFGKMTIIHTPWSAMVHIGLTALGFYLHRNVVHTAGGKGVGLLVFGPGAVGLVEPLVRLIVKMSAILHDIDFFKVHFVADPMEVVKSVAKRVK